MRSGRTIVSTIGVALALLVPVLAGAPAQAAPTTLDTSAASALAPAPGISPAAERVTHVGRYDFADYNCRLGRACLAVWDSTTGSWKVFDLFRCGLYHLSYWYDQGALKNSQTGGAVVRTFGADGGPIDSYPANGNAVYEVRSWSPVWTVRPC